MIEEIMETKKILEILNKYKTWYLDLGGKDYEYIHKSDFIKIAREIGIKYLKKG